MGVDTSLRAVELAHAGVPILVIGGGFFGASIALELSRRGYAVDLCERSSQLLGEASFHNQARIHSGGHYPRSLMTALRSRENYDQFRKDYSFAVYDQFRSHYMVSRVGSKVSAPHFLRFLDRIGLSWEEASPEVSALWSSFYVEGGWEVPETCFDAVKLREHLLGALEESEVGLALDQDVLGGTSSPEGIRVEFSDRPWANYSLVFNVTYASINQVSKGFGLQAVPLRQEVTEMSLVRVPEEFLGKSFTVMCGPFFSLMPFPSRGEGVYTLSHVRYTPHFSWEEGGAWHGHPREQARNILGSFTSNFAYMRADASRYLPGLRGLEYLGSLWAVKTILPLSDLDDGRPILFCGDREMPGFYHVLGGKLDNIYDMFSSLNSVGLRGKP
jgi:glycine/D-amino acid oxidase-like deaminating enzyme